VKSATAYSPCNITGFFQIHDKASDPLQVGSTGAGVALAKGVNTKLSVKKAQASRVDATFNGKRLPRRSVSARVATRYIELRKTVESRRHPHQSTPCRVRLWNKRSRRPQLITCPERDDGIIPLDA